MKMTDDSRVLIVHDITLIWRRSGGGKWVAILGPDYAVHFHQPPGCAWSAWKPFALEPIATARTLDECVLKVKQQYEARLARIRARQLGGQNINSLSREISSCNLFVKAIK